MDAAGVVPHLFLYYFTDANNEYRYTRNKKRKQILLKTDTDRSNTHRMRSYADVRGNKNNP
jgi:hypothetical protein